jgi:hypothetical protein
MYVDNKERTTMYNDYSVQLMHEDRLRDAAKLRSQSELIRDASEPVPNEFQAGLLYDIRQWMQARSHQTQETADVRHAHAI